MRKMGDDRSPPTHGRSLREFEEQLTSLRKENFNLKLRLYIMEESMKGLKKGEPNVLDIKEHSAKEDIDSKMQIETLRKEIHEKQLLLVEAAEVLKKSEAKQKNMEINSQQIINDLQKKLNFLENKLKQNKDDFKQTLSATKEFKSKDAEVLLDQEQQIGKLKEALRLATMKVTEFQSQIDQLDCLLLQRDATIKEYDCKLKEMSDKTSKLTEMVEQGSNQIEVAEKNLKNLELSNKELVTSNQKLVRTLNSIKDSFKRELFTMKLCETQMRDQQDTLTKMQHTISAKSANTTKLLERIEEYERVVAKMNVESTIASRENYFFRAIINKLHKNEETYSIEKNELVRHLNLGVESGMEGFDFRKLCEHIQINSLPPTPSTSDMNRIDIAENYYRTRKFLDNFNTESRSFFKLANLRQNFSSPHSLVHNIELDKSGGDYLKDDKSDIRAKLLPFLDGITYISPKYGEQQ